MRRGREDGQMRSSAPPLPSNGPGASRQGPPKGPPLGETPRQLIRQAPPGTLGSDMPNRELSYEERGLAAATPKTVIREMQKEHITDPFNSGKQQRQPQSPQSQPQQQDLASADAGQQQQQQQIGRSGPVAAMTPRTTMREAPVGALGTKSAAAAMHSSSNNNNNNSKENPADLLRAFKSKGPQTPPSVSIPGSTSPNSGSSGGGLAVAHTHTQEIPFSNRNSNSNIEGPPAYSPTQQQQQQQHTPPASSSSSSSSSSRSGGGGGAVKASERGGVGSVQLVSGVPPKPKRGKKGARPPAPVAMVVPGHGGAFEGFLVCLNTTLTLLIVLTGSVLLLVLYISLGDRAPVLTLPSLRLPAVASSLWSKEL